MLSRQAGRQAAATSLDHETGRRSAQLVHPALWRLIITYAILFHIYDASYQPIKMVRLYLLDYAKDPVAL